MKAVIMAGGKGSRMKGVQNDLPKPMLRIAGKPIIEYQIESLLNSGIRNIIIVVGYLKNSIIDYFGDGSKLGISIQYIEEMEPLGTAGALYYLRDEVDDFILLFGDLILDIDFNRFVTFHNNHNADVTLYVHPNSHPADSDVVEVDKNNLVTRILYKSKERDFYYHNIVNSGVYCVNPRALGKLEKPQRMDLEKDLITDLILNGNVYAYRSVEYVRDMGTPQRFQEVIDDVSNGIVRKKCLKEKQKAIFLDRDGTINRYVGYLRDINKFEFLPGVTDAVRIINASSYLTIVATNQPVIARGEVSYLELDKIHKKMETEAAMDNAYFDDIIYCPHHPQYGFEGEIIELKIDCDCRKPKIGMMKEAEKKYNINLKRSWMVGDTTSDIQTGKNAGMRTILVKTGEGGSDKRFDVQPDFVADDLLAAVRHILSFD